MAEASLWRDFWVLMALWALGQLIYVGAVNPQILVHRMGLKKGTEPWDWIWLLIFVAAFFGILLVANLDIRANGDRLPDSLRPVGLVLFVLGGGLFIRAMGENPFFEKTVRIQHELEDRTLQTKLPGYADYATRVRSRLLPGVW